MESPAPKTPVLLVTRLRPPALRRRLVPRPRLTGRLDAGLLNPDRTLARKLTLISATAGYGKTTLLVTWIQSTGLPAAWLSLDPGDNDPAQFWRYGLAALQAVVPGLGREALSALQPADLEPFVTPCSTTSPPCPPPSSGFWTITPGSSHPPFTAVWPIYWSTCRLRSVW